MIVKHNITAINANRNLNAVVSSQQKSTEKLSSGYKINRAADDAAGLSISEKMRRQVRGLTQASLNTQDGISFVQSAEGALHEVHDILQRGNELAVKAANDTNTAEEREAIYQEIQQINKEIDRIARDTQFNEFDIFDSSNIDPSMKIPGYGPKKAADTITLDADYMVYDMQDFKNAINEAKKFGKTFTQNGLAGFANALHDTYMPKLLDKIAQALPNSAKPTVQGLKISLNMYCENNGVLAYVGSNGVEYQLGVNLNYLTESSGAIAMTDDLATTIAHEMTHAVMFDAVTNGMLGSGGGDKFPMWFVEGTAQAIGGAINYCGELLNTIPKGDKAIENWLSKLTDTSNSYNAYAQGYIGSMYLGYVAGGEGAVTAQTIAKGLDAILKDIEDGYSLGQAIFRQTKGKYNDLADFEGSFGKDAVGFAKDLVNAINPGAGGTGSIASPNGLSGNKNSLLSGGGSNNYFELDVNQSDYFDNSGVLTGKNPYTGGGATTTGGLDKNGNPNPDADKKWGSSLSGGGPYHAGSMFIQAGAEAGQHITFSTFKLSAKDLGVADVKVDSHETAGQAINKYKQAIKIVSTMRSEYGSVQNRLEHTRKNLDNIVENTQAAESAIRDTDIAEEMVEYSVNNVLAQSGTSMLAQANQSKQLALQLLG